MFCVLRKCSFKTSLKQIKTRLYVFQDFFFVRGTEHALIQQKDVSTKHLRTNSKQKTEEYHACLVITHDSQQINFQIESERNSLHLNYFLILTSKIELFPTQDKKGGEFKDTVLKELSGDYFGVDYDSRVKHYVKKLAGDSFLTFNYELVINSFMI